MEHYTNIDTAALTGPDTDYPTRAHGGLFTDLSIYPYGGTSADLSKKPPILRGIIIYCPR